MIGACIKWRSILSALENKQHLSCGDLWLQPGIYTSGKGIILTLIYIKKQVFMRVQLFLDPRWQETMEF